MMSLIRIVWLLPILGLVACGGEDEEAFEQQKASATEPENHSQETANRIRAPYAYNRNGSLTGVYGTLEAGESDYYVVVLDFFDSGNHQIWLKDLSSDLDLEIVDWNDQVISSQGAATSNEVIYLNTTDVGFFGDGPDEVRIWIRVYGKTGTENGDFTLEFWTFDN